MDRNDGTFEVRNPEIEKKLREIGQSIGDKMPKGYGFTLMIFGYGSNPDFFYISSGDRQDMINTMREFIQKYEHN